MFMCKKNIIRFIEILRPSNSIQGKTPQMNMTNTLYLFVHYSYNNSVEYVSFFTVLTKDIRVYSSDLNLKITIILK